MPRFLTPKLQRRRATGGGDTGVPFEAEEFSAGDASGGTAVGTTPVTVPIARENYGSGSAFFDIASGIITFNEAGRALIVANVGISTQGSTGYTAECWLEVDTGAGFNEIPDTRAYMGAGTV